jgi:prevent-host-death family protein
MDTEQVAISDARANLTEIVANVRLLGKTVILTQRGTPKAAIVPLELLRQLQRPETAELDGANMPPLSPELVAAIQDGIEQSERGETVDLGSFAEAEPDSPAAKKTRKPSPHRCPIKGWCETCNEWKGGK